MPGTKTHNSDINLQGKLSISNVPNSSGTLLTYNLVSNEVSTRTNTEIIADLQLNSTLTGYVKRAGDTMFGSLTFDQTTSRIRKDLSAITTAGGFARTMFELNGTNGLIDITGWFGSVDASGNVTMNYGFIGGTVYNGINAIRYNSAMQVAIGGNVSPTGNYTLEVMGNSLSRGAVNAWGIFNTTSTELQLQRFGVNRIRTNTNSTIISGDTTIGIVYIRPQGDAVATSQILFNGNNTSQYTDNHNILFGTQNTVGSSIFHTNISNTIQGYGVWMAHNLNWNGTDFTQPRGTAVGTYALTVNNHKGFSFNYAAPNGTAGAVITLNEVAKIDNTGKMTANQFELPTSGKSLIRPGLSGVNNERVHNKIFNDSYSTAQTGILSFKITPPNTSATMFDMTINIYCYQLAAAAEFRLTFYKSAATTINAAGDTCSIWSTENFPTELVSAGFDSAGNMVINFGDVTTAWNTHISFEIERIETKYTGGGADWASGWSSSIITDTTGYTLFPISPIERLATRQWVNTTIAALPDNNIKTLGNGVAKHNLPAIDTFTVRNATIWATGANRPPVGNSGIVNFTPYSSGGLTYGFSLGVRNGRMYFVSEEASVFGNWNELFHTGNISTAPFITSNTNQTGLTGDKTTAGNWVFNGTGATGISLLRPGNTINNSIAYGFDTASHYLGLADTNTFVLGSNANLILSNRHFWIDTSATKTANLPGQIGGSVLASRDLGGFTITTTTNTNRSEMILRHNWSANNRTFTIGGVSSSTSGSMSQWGMYRYFNDRTVNGNDGFFGWVSDTDTLRATALSGTGTRMVIAAADGTLSTQTIPTATGTVTSVGMTVPTGLAVANSPITTSGSLDITFQAGYSIPTNANQTNWTNAFNFTSNFATNNPNLTAIEALSGINGYLRKTGPGTWELVTSPVGIATATNAGIAKLFSDTVQSVAANGVTATALRTYGVQLNSEGQLVVNVPWVDTDTIYTLPAATSAALGGVRLITDTQNTVVPNAPTNTASRTYAVQFNNLNQLVVNIPWTDTVYSLSPASSTVLGGIKLASDTVQTVPIESITATAKKTYGLQVNSSGQGVVNVPWTDTVYTHPTSGVTAGTYRSVTVNTLGHVTAGTNPTTLAGYGITDAMSTSHPANSITSPMISSWNSAAGLAHSHSNKPLLDVIDQQLATYSSPRFNNVLLNDNLGYGETIFGEDNVGGESGIVNTSSGILYAGKFEQFLKYGSVVSEFQGINYDIEQSIVGIGRASIKEKLEVEGKILARNGFIHEGYNSPNYGLASDGSVFDISALVPQQNSQVRAINTGADVIITPVGALTVVQLVDGTGAAPNGKIVLPLNATVGQEVLCINISSNNAAVYQAGNPLGLIGLGANYQLRCNFVLDGGPGTSVGGTGAGKWIVGNISMTNHIL